MQSSRDRILTTHVGSLPRPPAVVDLLKREDRDEAVDPAAMDAVVASAVAEVVARQVAIGIDVVNDGEMSKPSYATYIQRRLSGFGPVDPAKWPVERNPDREAFPEYYRSTAAASGAASRRLLGCIGPVTPRDRQAVARDLAHLRAAVEAAKPTAAFVTAASPGVVSRFHPNFYYPSSAAFRNLSTLLSGEPADSAPGDNGRHADADNDRFAKLFRIKR